VDDEDRRAKAARAAERTRRRVEEQEAKARYLDDQARRQRRNFILASHPLGVLGTGVFVYAFGLCTSLAVGLCGLTVSAHADRPSPSTERLFELLAVLCVAIAAALYYLVPKLLAGHAAAARARLEALPFAVLGADAAFGSDTGSGRWQLELYVVFADGAPHAEELRAAVAPFGDAAAVDERDSDCDAATRVRLSDRGVYRQSVFSGNRQRRLLFADFADEVLVPLHGKLAITRVLVGCHQGRNRCIESC